MSVIVQLPQMNYVTSFMEIASVLWKKWILFQFLGFRNNLQLYHKYWNT